MLKSESTVRGLLKNGEEQADAFYRWLVDEKKLSRKTADRHAFNAVRLIDYLANYPCKNAAEMNELDFREFFFDHSIRKLIGGIDAGSGGRNSLGFVEGEV